LSAAIWRVLFEQREIDPEKLSRVVEYVRKQVEQEMCASQNMPVYINYQTV